MCVAGRAPCRTHSVITTVRSAGHSTSTPQQCVAQGSQHPRLNWVASSIVSGRCYTTQQGMRILVAVWVCMSISSSWGSHHLGLAVFWLLSGHKEGARGKGKRTGEPKSCWYVFATGLSAAFVSCARSRAWAPANPSRTYAWAPLTSL